MWEWLTQNKEWVFSGIGLTVIGIVWWIVRQFGSRREPANAVTQSPSITVSPTIHVGSNLPLPEPHREQPRPVAPRSRPNLICRPETIRVHFTNYEGRQHFYETPDQDGFYAVVARLRNDPLADGRGLRAEHVRVNIIYRDDSGNEIGTGIARASWLGDNMDMMDLHVGETQSALLVVREPEGKLSNLGKERRRGGFYGDTIKANV